MLDLRHRMKEALKALDKGEKVSVFYRGKLKGTIIPVGVGHGLRVADHPFFGMARDEQKTVSEQVDELRRSRFDDI